MSKTDSKIGAVIGCRHFNGYKPCGKSEICDPLCPHLSVPTVRILLVHLAALGAVLRSTALLPAVRRKYPGAHITWVTQKPAHLLLSENPLIDRVLTTDSADLLALSALEFDIALMVDKGQTAAGVLKLTHADLVYGFSVDPRSGAVVPATDAASELWEIGLSNRKKFFENQKTETQLTHEALELETWQRDDYVLRLSEAERAQVAKRRLAWAPANEMIIGLNTGCSDVIEYKKLSIDRHRDLIEVLSQTPGVMVVLLGGREDSDRNTQIARGLNVIQSPTQDGLRDGIVSVAACDVVVTGDSLGMHLAIALKKWTVAWFGPTCAQEIDLYDRGVRVMSAASCGPCWKRSCSKATMCYDLVSVEALMKAIYAIAMSREKENASCPDLARPLNPPIR